MSEDLKLAAARAALDLVQPGMKLGIGTGSTANAFISALAERVRDGLEIVGVPTSERTRELCEAAGIELSTLDETPVLDLTVDGADEIDPDLNLIKGGGGALLREKIVAYASRQMVVIADGSKLVERLGGFPLPVEVNEFGLEATRHAIVSACRELGLDFEMNLRGDEEPYRTDGGHLIFDIAFARIDDASRLSDALLGVPGVVQHGLFIAMADRALIATPKGLRDLTRPS